MKVQTHVRAGELAATFAPSATGQGTPVHSPNGTGKLWLDELQQFAAREVKPWLTDVYREFDDPNRAQVPMTSASLRMLDSASLSFARRWLDPLFDDTRDRQRLALDANLSPPEATPAERTINRYIVVSLGTIAATVAHTLFFPPLLLVALAGALYMTLPIYVEAYEDLIHTRRIKSAFTYALGITGAWLAVCRRDM